MSDWRDRLAIEVYYDGWCPLCTAAKRRIAGLDWFGLIRFVSIREPGAADRVGVEPALLEKRMYVRDASGRTANGIGAVAAIALRAPALLPLWPFVAFSRLLGVGNWLYDQIAARRTIVPVGPCDENGCPVHAGRPPDDLSR